MTSPPPVPPPYGSPPTGPAGYPGYAAQGLPAQPPYGAAMTPARPPVKVWDLVLTVVLLVALVLFTAFASFAGLFLVMASDSCGVRHCSTDLIVTGWLVGTLLPWVVLIAAAAVSIVFLVKRRIAFYIPLLGAVGVVGALVLGFIIAAAGVPSG